MKYKTEIKPKPKYDAGTGTNTCCGRAMAGVRNEWPCTHPKVGLTFAMIASLTGAVRDNLSKKVRGHPTHTICTIPQGYAWRLFLILADFEGF